MRKIKILLVALFVSLLGIGQGSVFATSKLISSQNLDYEITSYNIEKPRSNHGRESEREVHNRA